MTSKKKKVSHEWLFTEPSEQIFIKRGDPLGWGDIADKYSNMLVPGLSKRTYNARWITILCWCLYVSKNAPLKYFLNTRNGQRERYQWLRPLELIWIAHALAYGDDSKGKMQLPGRRGVQKWVKMPKTKQYNDNKFGLSTDQWNRYRYSGIYGAYRVSLRKLHGLTVNEDGWTPDDIGTELAKLVENELSEIQQDEIKIKPRCKPESHWINNVWKKLAKNSSILPSSETIVLPEKEREFLKKALFCDCLECNRRRIVAETIGKMKAGTYSELCSKIAEKLEKSDDGVYLSLLAPFSKFSDSAIDVFIEIINIMEKDESAQISIKELVKDKNVLNKIDSLVDETNEWIKESVNIRSNTKIDFSLVNELAKSISNKNKDEIEILKVLINYHIYHGGGRKWFNLINSDYLELAIPIKSNSEQNSKPNRYRFRLWQLAQMAVQCGVIEQRNLPEVLKEGNDEEIQ